MQSLHRVMLLIQCFAEITMEGVNFQRCLVQNWSCIILYGRVLIFIIFLLYNLFNPWYLSKEMLRCWDCGTLEIDIVCNFRPLQSKHSAWQCSWWRVVENIESKYQFQCRITSHLFQATTRKHVCRIEL